MRNRWFTFFGKEHIWTRIAIFEQDINQEVICVELFVGNSVHERGVRKQAMDIVIQRTS